MIRSIAETDSGSRRVSVYENVRDAWKVSPEFEHRLGNVVWRGLPLQVARPVNFVHQARVPFLVYPYNLPFGGHISLRAVSSLLGQVRSRYAHASLHVEDTGEQLMDGLSRGWPSDGKPVVVGIWMSNESHREICLPQESKPLLFWYVPQKALLSGDEIVVNGFRRDGTQTAQDGIRIEGKEGFHWKWSTSTSEENGERETDGVYLWSPPLNNRRRINPNGEPLVVPETGTFENARVFFEGVSEVVSPPEVYKGNGFTVGTTPAINLPLHMCAILSPNVYTEVHGILVPTGMQTSSRYIEGRAGQTNLEIVGYGEWIKMRFARTNGEKKPDVELFNGNG